MIYCKIQDNKVIEYPVYPVHIKTRGHRVDMYTQVIEREKPQYDDNIKDCIEYIELIDGVPYQIWTLQDRVPKRITPRQARLQLLKIGLLDDLEALISTNRAQAIEWEFATEIKRDNTLVNDFAEQVGLTKEQVDTMFKEAIKL